LENMLANLLGLQINPGGFVYTPGIGRGAGFKEALLKRSENEGGVYTTHEYLDVPFDSGKIDKIVLVRDLRDTCVSEAYYRDVDWGNGLKKLLKGGCPNPSFIDFYLNNHSFDHMLVKFENLIVNGIETLKKISDYFGYDFSERIEEVYLQYDFTKLSDGRKPGEEIERLWSF